MKRSIDKLRHGDVFYSRIVFDAPLLEGGHEEQRMKMDSRERVMASLRREVPDRVPDPTREELFADTETFLKGREDFTCCLMTRAGLTHVRIITFSAISR